MTAPPVILIGLALAALTLAAPAWAQTSDAGPISTAPASPPPQAATAAAAPLPVNTVAPGNPDAPQGPDGKVHGMVEAGIGTGGYRHAAAAIDAPLQGGGEVAIAVDGTQYDGPSGRHR